MVASISLMLLGFVFLYLGGESLVKGSVSLALRLKASRLIIGLTLVAIGTSSPELIVSIEAALQNKPSLALGNIIGSNICNIGLILGLCTLITPICIRHRLIRFDVPFVVVTTLLLCLFLFKGSIGSNEAIILLVLFFAYLGFLIWKHKALEDEMSETESATFKILKKPLFDYLYVFGGGVLLILGSRLLIKGATEFSALTHLTDPVIGLTIVAIGTSLPELSTSLIAILKGEGDIALGNILGSNIFNSLVITGTLGLITPINLKMVGSTTLWIMLGVTLLLLPCVRDKKCISKKEGVLLLLTYLGYTIYLYTGFQVA